MKPNNKIYTVCKIVNKKYNKVYVGRTSIPIEKRFNKHINSAMKSYDKYPR